MRLKYHGDTQDSEIAIPHPALEILAVPPSINFKSFQHRILLLVFAACITIPGFQIEFGRPGLRCAPTASSSVLVAVPTQHPHTEDPDTTATVATDLRCASQQGASAGAGLRPGRSAEVAERGVRRDSEATGLCKPRLENAAAIGRHPYGPETGCSQAQNVSS